MTCYATWCFRFVLSIDTQLKLAFENALELLENAAAQLRTSAIFLTSHSHCCRETGREDYGESRALDGPSCCGA